MDSNYQIVQEIINHEIRLRTDFKYFTRTVFKDAVELSGLAGVDAQGNRGKFIYGDFTDSINDFLENNPWTIRVSARDHFKSFSLYAHFMWTMYKKEPKNLECWYFSYKEDLAGYHISKIKKLIKASPAFDNFINLKTASEATIAYRYITDQGEYDITLNPSGLLMFSRGLHPNGPMYIDDPLKDPQNKLDPVIIRKINDAIRLEILPMPQGELHIVGTPQTNQDFFFDSNLRLNEDEVFSKVNKKFKVKIQPAIQSYTEKKVIFPEWKSFEELMNIKARDGEKVFNQEYMCMPAYSQDSYLPLSIKEDPKIVIAGWQGVNPLDYKTKSDSYGGWDLGQAVHPAHFVAWEKVSDNPIKRRVIYEKWMDGWDYSKQLDFIKDVSRQLDLDKVYYDKTRGELLGFDEMGIVPPNFEGISFNNKSKSAMANVLYKEITAYRLELIDSQRFINQILAVNNELNAVFTSGEYGGHGDSFWSLALSLFALTIPEPRIRSL